jgi:ketosteroid isomerase-like protein
MKRIVLLVLMLAFSLRASGQTPQSELEAAFQRFTIAFENLDWEQFRKSFADDATVFFPRGFPSRADGREQYESKFRVVFEQLKNGKTGPPYHSIRPKDLKTQMIGKDVAIITFHLDDRPGMLNRRTIVFRKMAQGWKIVHLHASEVSLPSH